MTNEVDKEALKIVLEKLDNLELELFRLRAMLVPEDDATCEEKKEIADAEREIGKGSTVTVEELIKELGC